MIAGSFMCNSYKQMLLNIILFFVAVIMGEWVFSHFSPGALSPDSLQILKQARTGVFEDGHPPLMAVIWRWVDYICPGPIGMLLLNMVLFYGGLFFIYCWGGRRYQYVVLPMFVIVGLFPPIIGILGVIWVDIMMAGFLLSAIGVFLFGFGVNRDEVGSKFFVLACLFALLGVAVRHNGAAAAFPLIVFFLYQQFGRQSPTFRRVIFSMVGGGVVTIVFFLGARQAGTWIVDEPKHFWRVGAIYDIAGASFREKSYLFNSELFRDNSLEDIDKLYSPRSLTPLLIGEQVHALPGLPVVKGNAFDIRDMDPSQNSILFSNWVAVICNHPAAYLAHRHDVFISLITRSPWGLWAPTFEVIYPNDLGVYERPLRQSTYFDHVRLLARHSSIFEPLLYLGLCAIALLPALVVGLRFQNDALLLAAALYGSGLAHMVGLFLLAGSADFRYSHWMITATVLGTSFVFLEIVRLLRIFKTD